MLAVSLAEPNSYLKNSYLYSESTEVPRVSFNLPSFIQSRLKLLTDNLPQLLIIVAAKN